jgi:hypothetical protein
MIFAFLHLISAPDGRAYVGVSQRPFGRWRDHVGDGHSELGRAIRENGLVGWRFDILHYGAKAKLLGLRQPARSSS